MVRPSLALLLLGLMRPPGAGAQAVIAPTWARNTSGHVADSLRRTTRSQAQAGPTGLAAGLANWPADMYCGGTATGAVQPLDPREVLDRVQLAARCGVRLVIIIPRRYLTTTHEVAGPFSLDQAKQATDRYASILPPDTLAKYRATLLGLNLADDYTCLRCWGGQEITQAELADWATYTRAKLPGLPLGIRHTPEWVAESPPLAASIDYVWAQYHAKRGDAKRYFAEAAEAAGRLGLRVVMGVNTHNCNGPGSGRCKPDDILRYGTTAIEHPGNCAFLSYRYDDAWDRPEIRAAWDSLFALAKTRPTVDCRRGGTPTASH